MTGVCLLQVRQPQIPKRHLRLKLFLPPALAALSLPLSGGARGHPAFGSKKREAHRQCECNLHVSFAVDFAGLGLPLSCPLRESRGSDSTVLACRLRYFAPVPKVWKTAAWRPANLNAKGSRDIRGGLEVSFDKARAGLGLNRHLAKLM